MVVRSLVNVLRRQLVRFSTAVETVQPKEGILPMHQYKKTCTQITPLTPLTPDSYKALNIKGNADFSMNKTRPGVLAFKKGMMTIYDERGAAIPVTCLHIDRCQALGTNVIDPVGRRDELKKILTRRVRAMHILEVGMGRKSPRQLSISRLQYFNKLGVPPKRHVRGFTVESDCVIPAGHHFRAAHFVPGQYVDVQAKSIGKGFQGVMKRWGFHGFPASHGHSLSHRSRGSNGARSLGRVWKGTKMAGRMGGKFRTVHRLKVVRVDNALNLVYVKGAVPGSDDAMVRIIDTRIGGNKDIFAAMPPPYPTFMPRLGQKLPRLMIAGSSTERPLVISKEDK